MNPIINNETPNQIQIQEQKVKVRLPQLLTRFQSPDVCWDESGCGQCGTRYPTVSIAGNNKVTYKTMVATLYTFEYMPCECEMFEDGCLPDPIFRLYEQDNCDIWEYVILAPNPVPALV